MDRESFIFYRSFYEAIKCMPSEVQAEIYPAICEYALFGKMPKNLSDMARGMFTLIKPNIDVNTTRYENGKKGAQYGKRGGRPKKGQATSADPAYTQTFEQEVEQMRADEQWRKTICEDFNISTEEYDKRLSRFLVRCNDDKARKGKERHDSFVDCQSHLRYWMTKAYPQQQTTPPPPPDNDSVPFPEMGDSFGGVDYDEQ